MIRPVTCICLVLAAGSGLFLYQTKHQAQLLDREIARTLKQADATRQRAGLLRAEYALLNDPTRLADLSAQLLPELKTTTPGQFSTLADLDRRLPEIGAPPAAPAPLEPDAPEATLPKPPPEASVVAVAEPTRPEPVRPPEFVREPPRPEPVRSEPARSELARSEPIRSEPIRSEPTRPVVVAAVPRPRPPAPPRPAPTLAAMPAVAIGAEPRPLATPVYASAPQAGPIARVTPVMSGSALGMARTMFARPQPVPMYTGGSEGGGR